LKLKGWRTKFVLREAMKDAIPAQILNRPKMGFPVPLRTWFRGRYASIVREFVLGKSLQARGLFDHRALETLVAEHAAGSLDHSQRLWSILNLELWLRQAVDGEHYQQATDLIHELVVDHAGARS
jgi:asparagine synthase (glutamine-hydrolysing)